ncbi:hypothetical protein M8818_002708 [Zalaria obscura]|uniref:Uncharacterized protein n=1 Tax=Zalaria obscura TaxID=2024903 RepID=A0ACC3SJS6_9PEZI
MHIIKTLTIGASVLASYALAQSTRLAFTSTPASVTAGQAVTIKYSAADTTAPVTIILRKGDPNDLQTIAVLTSDSTGGSYTWIPADYFADDTDYALEITQGDEINYSGEFSLSGANAAAVSSASSASAASASSAAALTASYSVSSVIQSIQSAIASYNSSLVNLTATATPNATAVVVVTTTPGASNSLGTGIPMSRNNTMSSATLTSASASSGAAASTTSGGNPTTAGGGGSSTGSAATTSSTSGASVLAGSSPLALIFGVVAAFAYLN